jgi:hypothetical protein
VPLDTLDAHHQSAKSPHHPHATRAHLDPPDLKDHPAPLEALVAQDLLAAMETMEPLEPLDHKDLPAQLATLAQMDSPETLVPQLSLSHSSLETQAHKETLAHKVFPETQEHLEPMDNLETPDQKDLPDPLDHKDPLGTTASPVPVDLLDLRENVVFAPNTALWMVVFSSRMEQGDKSSAAQNFVQLSLFVVYISTLSRSMHSRTATNH